MAAGARPGYLRWASIGLVMIGGTLGAAGREGVSLAVPDIDHMPVAIPIVNIVGAFLLGYLTVAVARRLPGDPRGSQLKLLLGTGFCGGFTTYSSLATDTAVLIDDSHVDLAVVYVLATVVVGALATLAGIVVATRVNAQEQPAEEATR
jgi:fluoride exporter